MNAIGYKEAKERSTLRCERSLRILRQIIDIFLRSRVGLAETARRVRATARDKRHPASPGMLNGIPSTKAIFP